MHFMKCRIFCKCMWIMILWHSQHYAMIWEKILWNLCKNLCKFYANPNLYAFYASARDSLYSSFLAKKNFLLLLVVGHWQSDPHRSSLGDEDWWGFFRSSNEPLLGRPIPARRSRRPAPPSSVDVNASRGWAGPRLKTFIYRKCF